MKAPVASEERPEGKGPSRARAAQGCSFRKPHNFQRKLNFALLPMIKQLHSSNVTNMFLS